MKKFSCIRKYTHLSLLPAIFFLTGAPAYAQKAGDTVFGVGWFHIAPKDSSAPLNLAGVVVADSGANVDHADTLATTISYMLTDNVGMTLDAGIPPTFHLTGTGSLNSSGQLGSAKQWSPALVLKYYFGAANSSWRPFAGLGVSYVKYSDVTLSPSFTQQLSSDISGGATTSLKTSSSLNASWAPVINVGVNYKFSQNWSTTLSASYLKLKTNATLYTEVPDHAPVRSSASLTINPVVFLMSLNYTFGG